jgi:hypothetical protein
MPVPDHLYISIFYSLGVLPIGLAIDYLEYLLFADPKHICLLVQKTCGRIPSVSGAEPELPNPPSLTHKQTRSGA